MEQLDLAPIPFDDKDILQETFTSFKGTHACWVWDDKNGVLHLTKNGSTLFFEGESFSSVQFNTSKPALDGYVYKYYRNSGFLEYVQFSDSNPFAVFS